MRLNPSANSNLNCPVCNSPCLNRVPAVISPWIRELGVKSRVSKYLLCKTCNTGFFSKRYSDSEMSSIYKDYRGSNYVTIREKWENWYSHSYNANHDSEAWVQSRKKSLNDFILAQGSANYDRVVDIGGNRGEYIPEFAKSKYLLDISEREPITNVNRIQSLNEIEGIDLIIYAHILEHVRNPIIELENLFKHSKRIYVEVPFGVPVISKERKSKLRFWWHLMSSTTPYFWNRQAAPSTGRTVNPIKMLSQSEHLTFFSEDSMQVIATRLNANLVIQKSTIRTPDSKSGLVLQCLFIRNLE
jgi:Methyltransferase domain